MNATITLPEYQGLTKKTAELQAILLTEQVSEGYVNPLDALAKLTWLSTVADQALKQVRELALNEADKYPQKTFADYGAEFTVKETAVKYDYSDFKEWRELNSQLDGIKLEQKQLEERLRHTCTVPKKATTTICVTLKKQ